MLIIYRCVIAMVESAIATTPLATVNCVEIVVPQRTTIFLCVYQKHNTLIINKSTHFLINLSNSSQKFNLSKVLLALRNVTNTVVPLFL